MGFLGVEDGSGVALFFELLIEDGGELFLDRGVGGIGGEIGHFERIFRGVVKLFRLPSHVAIDEHFMMGF